MFSLRSFKESEAFALFSRHPHFRRLFLADAFSQVGQNMLVVAFPTLILEVTHDVTLTGLAFAGEILAYGVLAPWAGLIADRCEQKRLMQIANLGRTGEGTHRALDGRLLLADWRTATGHVYQARLRAELTQRLGVRWGPVRAGQADIAGVPRGVI